MRKRLMATYAQNICSFSLAFFTVVPTINMIFARTMSMEEEAMLTPLYALALLLVGISTFLSLNYLKKPSISFWIILISVLFTFGLTNLYGIKSTLNPLFFWLYTIISFIVPQIVLPNTKKMLRWMMILPSFGIVFVNQIFQLTDSGSIQMDLTYSFLIPIISSIVYLFTYFKQDKKWVKIGMSLVITINVVYLFFCLLFGSRAPGLSVILCIIFMLCTTANYEKKGFIIKRTFIWWVLIVVLFAVFFENILYLLVDLFKMMNWDSFNIDKMVMLYEMGDLSDGRSDIIDSSLRGIQDSLLWGHGISASEQFTNHTYPHNFILQLLLDGGILLTLIIMLPMIIKIIRLKKDSTFEEYVLITTLFFASVPGALFSLDIWANSRFWIFMGFLLSRTYNSYCKNLHLIKTT